ncbi:MAG TPA: hypothetical protein VFJ19_03440 [Nocardioidaceae bacterium]|nr:hypothetical protein [Nocardioidaceae bacterium]
MSQQTDDRVRSLLEAAAAPSEAGPVPGEQEALAAFRATVPNRSGRTRMRTHLTPARTAAATALSAALILAGSVSAAAAGALPDSAQSKAHDVLQTVGVDVPTGTDHGQAGEHPDHPANHGADVSLTAHSTGPGPDHGQAVSTAARDKTTVDDTSVAPGDTEATPNNRHGTTVSELAKSTEPGPSHGPTVAAEASGGKARAGGQGTTSGDEAHGKSGAKHGNSDETHPSADAGSRSDHATDGQTKAGEARGDHGSHGDTQPQ